MNAFFNDVNYALRLLRKSPGFVFVATVSLALGVSLNATVFSLVDALKLRSVPSFIQNQLVNVNGMTSKSQNIRFSYSEYLDLKEKITSLSGVIIQHQDLAILKRESTTLELLTGEVSRNYFSLLEVQPHLGHFFSESDAPDLKSADAVVIGYKTWLHDFDGDPDVIGRSIELNDKSHVIMAVAPRGFVGPNPMQPARAWKPINGQRWGNQNRSYRSFEMLGRLNPGASVEQTQREADVVFQHLKLCDEETKEPLHARVLTFSQYRKKAGGDGGMLLYIGGILLLLACTNVSSLMIARAAVRTKEMALRAALGGDRWRLIRHMLTENLMISLIALAVSLPFTSWAVYALPAKLIPPHISDILVLDMQMNGRVAAYSIAISLLSVFLCGLVPAWRSTKTNLRSLITEEAAGRTKNRGFRMLVSAQTCIALILIILASLIMRDIQATLDADLGFERKEYLLVLVSPKSPDQAQQIRKQAQALPGVKQVSMGSTVPLNFIGTGGSRNVSFLGKDTDQNTGGSIPYNAIDPNYFQVMGIPLLRGRSFGEQDHKNNTLVLIINEAMAHKAWPDENPLGQWVRLGKLGSKPVQVVGVVQNTKLHRANEKVAEPFFYLPLAQHHHNETMLILETFGKAAALADPTRSILRSINQEPLKMGISTMEENIRLSFLGKNLTCRLVTLFGLAALGLASIGLHGLIAYRVSRQTHDIGIRMALGARQHEILLLYLKRGLTPVVIGASIGLPIALYFAHSISGEIDGINEVEPISVIVGLTVVLSSALLACWLPARRAAKTNPMNALRCE